MPDAWDQFPDAPAGGAPDPWAQFPDAAAAAPPPREDKRYESLGRFAPVARGLEDISNLAGDPIGLRDEIVGAGEGVKAFVTSGGRVNPETWEKIKTAYNKGNERVDAENREARETYGILPEIVGGLGTTALARGFKIAPTLGGRIWQSAKTGAGFGAASGAGRAEGGFVDRVAGAAESGAYGAALGPLITEVGAPVVGALVRGGRATGRGLGDAARFVRSRGQNVDARLNRALEQQRQTPQQAMRQLDDVQNASRFGATQLDDRYTLADLGPATQDLADTAALVSSEARGMAGEFLGERARGSYGRINDYLRRGLTVARENFARRQANIVDEQRTLSGQAYGAAYANKQEFDVGQALFDAQLEATATAGPLQRTLNRARALFMDKSRAAGHQASLDTQRFDSGKRALDDMIQAARNGGRNNEARMLTQMKNELLNVADAANPNYRAARDVYSSRAELLDAMETGRTFMRGDSEMTGQAYRALSTGERRMFRLGIAQQVRRDLGSKRVGTDMVGYFDRPNTREVLQEIMSPAQAHKFYQLVELEQGLNATNQAIRGNSKTAQRQQNVADFSLSVRLGRAIKDRNLVSTLINEGVDQMTRLFAVREADAVALMQMLLETNPAAQRATLQRLTQTYGPRSTRQIVNRAQRVLRQRMITTRRSLAGITGLEQETMREPQSVR